MNKLQVSEASRELSDERLEAARQDSDAWLTWEEVKARVEASLASRR